MGLKILFLVLLSLSGQLTTHAQQLAFPTAEGYGKFTKGGRGGVVYEVTNLNDSGPGSLREAVEASGPRTVIFRLSGNIYLKSPLRIKNPYITIAGQTAPGDGICVAHYPLSIDADQVIIRYLRVRVGDISGKDDDAISSRFTKHIILDHLSASWSIDETLSVYHCDSVTVQWCIISESMYGSNHVKGSHGFGGIWGSNHGTYHHNLLAHHSSRNPRMSSGSGLTDFRNNVIYNWGYNSTYGGENRQVGDSRFSFSQFNIVSNYYKPGPATQGGDISFRIVNPGMRNDKSDFGKWYVARNVMHNNVVVTADNWNGGIQPSGGASNFPYLKMNKPWPSMAINEHNAIEAYAIVLKHSGAILPRRDAIDRRIVQEVEGGFATYGGKAYKKKSEPAASKLTGIIDSQADVGGWCELRSAEALADSDHDGIPDSWEERNGLDERNPEDRNTISADGYSMLEEYINSIN